VSRKGRLTRKACIVGLQAQIGFVDVLKTGNNGKWENLHGNVIAESGSDHAKLIKLLRDAGSDADYVVSTVDAVTESGDFIVADGSGTRIVPYVSNTKVIVLVGANKVVADVETGKDRLSSYVYALESARVRKVYGWPGAYLAHALTISTNGAVPGRIHFVIVKEHFGF